MSTAPSRREVTHDRIVEVAARALRRHGFDGVGVADVMKQAGLTHGGFYAHFASREALLAEAVERAGRDTGVRLREYVDDCIARGDTPGLPLEVKGTVFDGAGKPLAGATVDAWQASPVGLYENQDPSQPDMNLRGRFTTDEQGRYFLRTVPERTQWTRTMSTLQLHEWIAALKLSTECLHVETMFISPLRKAAPVMILANPRVTTSAQAKASGKPIVFLGWEPHPMNTRFQLAYLTGGDEVFGPNFGGATVFTNVRKGYLQECPNVGKLLQNLVFALPMESEVMGKILDDGMEAKEAATAWLKANPAVLDGWLAGVTTFDGGDGLAAVKGQLGS